MDNPQRRITAAAQRPRLSEITERRDDVAARQPTTTLFARYRKDRYNGGKGDLLMTKRANRVEWGLVGVLAVLLMAGTVRLLADFQCRLPEERRWVTLLPTDQWGFGRDEAAALRSDLFHIFPCDDYTRWPERYRLGWLSEFDRQRHVARQVRDERDDLEDGQSAPGRDRRETGV
jgi:hypothetical protein